MQLILQSSQTKGHIKDYMTQFLKHTKETKQKSNMKNENRVDSQRSLYFYSFKMMQTLF
jgi:hypothetical protein